MMIPMPTARWTPAAIAPVALIAALLVSSVVWVCLDQRVWPWDQAWYGEATLDLWFARSQGAQAWLNAALHALGSKPPLLLWIAQFMLPLSRVTGDIESSFLLVNVAAAGATLAVVYVVARRL